MDDYIGSIRFKPRINLKLFAFVANINKSLAIGESNRRESKVQLQISPMNERVDESIGECQPAQEGKKANVICTILVSSIPVGNSKIFVSFIYCEIKGCVIMRLFNPARKQEKLKKKVLEELKELRFTSKNVLREMSVEKCLTMMAKIEDQEFFQRIVEDKFAELSLRKAALERISDQKVLSKLYVDLFSSSNTDDRELSQIARKKVTNMEILDEARAVRKKSDDRMLTTVERKKAFIEAQKKALKEERTRKGLCPGCGSKNIPVYGLIPSLDMYGDYCPDCGKVIRLPNHY